MIHSRVHGFHIIDVINHELIHHTPSWFRIEVIATAINDLGDYRKNMLHAIVFDTRFYDYKIFLETWYNLTGFESGVTNAVFEIFLCDLYKSMVLSVNTSEHPSYSKTGKRIYTFRDIMDYIHKVGKIPEPDTKFGDITQFLRDDKMLIDVSSMKMLY